jgi:hypothetical protein
MRTKGSARRSLTRVAGLRRLDAHGGVHPPHSWR